MRNEGLLGGSFRDPAGYVFEREGVVFRALRAEGDADYRLLQESGLYDELTGKGLLPAHEEIIGLSALPSDIVRVLRPEQLPFFSYPYEWSFTQLRDAALLTLRVQRMALKHGLTLKDASAFNVSFRGTQPLFADILSFTRYEEGAPWQAYLQFCEQFFVPLLLSRRAGRSVSSLLRAHIDGIPLTLAARMLRGLRRFSPAELLHVHLHARSIRKNMQKVHNSGRPTHQSRQQTLALLDSLERTIQKMTAPAPESHWSGYYADTVYDEAETTAKENFIRDSVRKLAPAMVWDLGSNTGRYARIAAEEGATVIAMDADDAVVDAMYREWKKEKREHCTPLVMNLANPSPALGWAHEERLSLEQRGPADLVLYLGLIHHLRYTHMIPLEQQAAYLARIARNVILEWIPPDDPNVKLLARGSRSGFAYSRELLMISLAEYFDVSYTEMLESSGRELMVCMRKGAI
ncbi:class I SAM-dependent methyltransferase [bacterium]|nr:class I SAM-dependent methyltransferase [bacterium]